MFLTKLGLQSRCRSTKSKFREGKGILPTTLRLPSRRDKSLHRGEGGALRPLSTLNLIASIEAIDDDSFIEISSITSLKGAVSCVDTD